MTNRALQLHACDNIAVALNEISNGESVETLGPRSRASVIARQSIPFAHKIAITHISCGAEIIKYGVPIAVATAAIGKGEWVHVHNAVSPLSQTAIEGRHA